MFYFYQRMYSLTKITLVWSFLILFTTSCLKPESFPDEPVIEFVDFTALGDSGKLTFSFTDGDGDIGLTQNQLSPPFDSLSYYYYNLYIHYYEKMNGVWVRGTAHPDNFPTADSITWAYRLDNITPIGQNTALRGEVEIILEPRYFNSSSNHNDSLRYEFLLIDRNLNISNIVETPLIVR